MEKTIGVKMTDNQIFKETVKELNSIEITQFTQHKTQEALNDAAFSDLRNLSHQISNREKARLLSSSMPQLGAWLSAPSIPSSGLDLSQLNSEQHRGIELVFRYALKNEIPVLAKRNTRQAG